MSELTLYLVRSASMVDTADFSDEAAGVVFSVSAIAFVVSMSGTVEVLDEDRSVRSL